MGSGAVGSTLAASSNSSRLIVMSSLIPRPVLHLEDIEGLESAVGNYNDKQGPARRIIPSSSSSSRSSCVPAVEHQGLLPSSSSYRRHRADERGKNVVLKGGRGGDGCCRGRGGVHDKAPFSVSLESPHRQRCDNLSQNRVFSSTSTSTYCIYFI